jgi:hypothetical protein
MTLVDHPELLLLPLQMILEPPFLILKLLVLLPDHLQIPAHSILQFNIFAVFHTVLELLNVLQRLVKDAELVLELFNSKCQGVVLLDQGTALHLLQLIVNEQLALRISICLFLLFYLFQLILQLLDILFELVIDPHQFGVLQCHDLNLLPTLAHH